ncbi:MAG: hypothetical protein LJE57_02435 [Gallionella sp.]|nr:hypothetical protein [Gallionella sp.]
MSALPLCFWMHLNPGKLLCISTILSKETKMKRIALVVTLLALALSACGQKSAETAAPAAPAAPAAAPATAAATSAVGAHVADDKKQ